MAADSVAAVLKAWKEDAKLITQASTGAMAVVGRKADVTRKEVCHNANILHPVVRHFGPLALLTKNTIK